MLDFLNTLFRSLTPLWEMSVTAAYAAAVVIVLRLLLKKRAPRQVLCLLWLVVFARLLIPASPESPLSIVPSALPGQEYLGSQAPAEPGAGNPFTPAVPQNPAQNPFQNHPGNNAAAPITGSQTPSLSVPGDVSPAAPAAKAPASFPWQAVVAGVWLTGAAAMSGYAVVSYLRLRRRLFDAIRAGDGAWEHPAVDSPFILGVLRPRIYLPAGLTGRSRQFILCHERAHLRRFDHIVKPVCWVALALHWFNPLVWAAFLLMSRDIESACDEAVVRQLGSAVKADYSDTLLALATGRRLPAPCPLAFDEGDAKGRIRNVLNYRRPALWVIIVSVIAAALAAVCLLTDPVAAKESEDGPSPDPAASPDPGAAASLDPSPVITLPPDHSADTLLDPWMKKVLDGEREFLLEGRGSLTVDRLSEAIYDNQHNVTVSKVAIIDLDRDGVNEMVVWSSIGGDDSIEAVSVPGYLILRRQGDVVYGYNPPFRGFAYLKADGTFDWDNTAFEGGTATMSFDGGEYDLNYVSWFNISADKELYFVDGQRTGRDEFLDACNAQRAKPEPVWYRWYEDTGLLPAVVTPDQSTFTPRFLGDGMRELYRQASYFYYHLFGESTARICELESASYRSSGGYDPTDTVVRDGLTYVRATGQFARWADLMAAADALFTRDFWDSCNTWDGHELFINVDGATYFLPASRVAGDYYNTNVNPFTLAEQTDTSITITLTEGYNRCRAGESEEQWSQRTSRGFDYTVDYSIRLVKTENGWRFDEFHYGRTDQREYILGHILWQTEPLKAINGWMDEAILRQVGPDVFLDWDGTTYQIEPDVSYSTFTGRMYVLDVDGDGQTEASLVYLNGDGSPVIAVYERTGNGLQRQTFDTSRLLSWYDTHISVERNPAGGLTLTYRSPNDVTSMELSSGVFEGYEWLREGEIYAKMDPGFFYVGLAAEMPLTPPFGTHSFIQLSDGLSNGPYVASAGFQVEYDGSGFTIGKLWWEPYAEFAIASAF